MTEIRSRATLCGRYFRPAQRPALLVLVLVLVNQNFIGAEGRGRVRRRRRSDGRWLKLEDIASYLTSVFCSLFSVFCLLTPDTRHLMTEDRYQKSEKRKPQNTEQGIMNFEGKKLHHSKFLVRYSIFKTEAIWKWNRPTD
jgi:hypothetical protein